MLYKRDGFTLLELLIVMAIIAILATIALVAVNPREQIAQSKDTDRKNSVTQMGYALESYFTTKNSYPSPTSLASLIDAREIPVLPTNRDGVTTSCASVLGQGAVSENGYCYNASDVGTTPNVVIYTRVESYIENQKCPGEAAWFVWASSAGRAGTVCTASATSEPPINIVNFAD